MAVACPAAAQLPTRRPEPRSPSPHTIASRNLAHTAPHGRPAFATHHDKRMPNSPDHLHYAILKALEENPNLSQRELAQTLGLSLGKANYCLQELIKKGQVKVENFRRQDNKLAYAYILTPAGLAAKVKVTRRFLARKLV